MAYGENIFGARVNISASENNGVTRGGVVAAKTAGVMTWFGVNKPTA